MIHMFRVQLKCALIYIYIYTGYKKVNKPLIFLQIFKYVTSWDNIDKMTL